MVMFLFVICIFIFITKTLLLSSSTFGTMQFSCISSSSKSGSNFLFKVFFFWSTKLCCYIKHSHFIPYGMHSLPSSISLRLTSVVALHYYSVLFLRPFSSSCPTISSSSITTGPILLTNGTSPRWYTLTWSSSLIDVVVGFTFIWYFNTNQRISNF